MMPFTQLNCHISARTGSPIRLQSQMATGSLQDLSACPVCYADAHEGCVGRCLLCKQDLQYCSNDTCLTQAQQVGRMMMQACIQVQHALHARLHCSHPLCYCKDAAANMPNACFSHALLISVGTLYSPADPGYILQGGGSSSSCCKAWRMHTSCAARALRLAMGALRQQHQEGQQQQQQAEAIFGLLPALLQRKDFVTELDTIRCCITEVLLCTDQTSWAYPYSLAGRPAAWAGDAITQAPSIIPVAASFPGGHVVLCNRSRLTASHMQC